MFIRCLSAKLSVSLFLIVSSCSSTKTPLSTQSAHRTTFTWSRSTTAKTRSSPGAEVGYRRWCKAFTKASVCGIEPASLRSRTTSITLAARSRRWTWRRVESERRRTCRCTFLSSSFFVFLLSVADGGAVLWGVIFLNGKHCRLQA